MVALISGFLALGIWALLPAIMLVLLLVTAGVVGAIGRLLGQEDAPEPVVIATSA